MQYAPTFPFQYLLKIMDGSLKDLNVIELLQLLLMGQKSGILKLTNKNDVCKIYFSSGKVVYALSDDIRYRLGDMLLRFGYINKEEKANLNLDLQKEFPENVYWENSNIKLEKLKKFLLPHIEETIYNVLGWNEGYFDFVEKELTNLPPITLDKNTQSLIMEGSRRLDEWSLISKKISSVRTIFALDTGSEDAGITLKSREWQLLAHINGKYSIQDILEQTNWQYFDIFKMLYGLLATGFVKIVGEKDITINHKPLYIPKNKTSSKVDEIQYIEQGKQAFIKDDFDNAVKQFVSALAVNEKNLQAHLYLGITYYRLGYYKQAQEELTSYYLRYSNEETVIICLGLSYWQQKNYKMTLELWKKHQKQEFSLLNKHLEIFEKTLDLIEKAEQTMYMLLSPIIEQEIINS